MDTTKLKSFAQEARRQLLEQVAARLKQVLDGGSRERRESPVAIQRLEQAIAAEGTTEIVDKVAYIWFNRFCALRFMDINGYNRVRIVSPADGQTQPEILAEAKMGVMDEAIPDSKRRYISELLSGQATSHDPQTEAYRTLLVASCNQWHKAMPFLFQSIDDYTELLMPSDLLSQNSVLSQTLAAIDEENHQDVEVIGWLYQYYISEKKDEVFEELKNNKKITPNNIPAATQLFTPNWIVRYLVQNSLGRLWLLNKPNSALAKQMEYYIPEETASNDYLKISRPEQLKICDPACGSGHMLTYAFDLLYSIYEEEGYAPNEIPELILTNNLYGIEIDERAGELAAFALTMKARAKHRRFFNKSIKPNICILQNVVFSDQELQEYIDVAGRDLFTINLRETLKQFGEVDNFGSLVVPKLKNPQDTLNILASLDFEQNLFLKETHERVLKVLTMSDYLSQKYHVVIANPPYMGGKGMNPRLSTWLKDNYADVKSDLFSAFIVRNTYLALPKGQLGFMTPFVWMFISSYEKLRHFIIDEKTITSLIQLEYSGFDGATVPICTFTLENAHNPDFKGGYVRLSDFKGADIQGSKALEIIQAAKAVGK